MDLQIARISLTGDRKNNEDYANFVSRSDGAVLIVADGLGGREFGEWASEAFTEGVLAQQAQLLAADFSSRETAKPVFNDAFVHGTDNLRDVVRARDETADPQTTAVVAVITGQAIAIGHIEDSRAYRLTPSAAVDHPRQQPARPERVDSADDSGHPLNSHQK